MKDIVFPPITKLSVSKPRRNGSNIESYLANTEWIDELKVDNDHTTHKECQEAMKIIDSLLKRKGKMNQKNIKLKQDLANEKNKVAQLEQELNKKRNPYSVYESNNKNSGLNNKNDEEEIEKLKRKIDEVNKSNHSFHEENLQLKDKVFEYEKKMKEIVIPQQAKIEIKGTNSVLKEIIRLKKEIESNTLYKNSHLEQTIKDLENDNRDLKNQISELKTQKSSLEMKSQSVSQSIKLKNHNKILVSNQNEKEKERDNKEDNEGCKQSLFNNSQHQSTQGNYDKDFFESFFTNEEKGSLKLAFKGDDISYRYSLFKKKINCLLKAKNSVEQRYKLEIKHLVEKLNDLNQQIDYLNDRNKTIEFKYKKILQKIP